MRKKVIAVLLSAALVTGIAACDVTATIDVNPDSNTEAGNEDTKDDSQASSDQTKSDDESVSSDIDYTTGTPWLDCDLEGTVTPDTQVQLKDHFYLAVNKESILDQEIPEGYSVGGTIMDVDLKAIEDTKKLFMGDEPDSHDGKLAYDLFWLLMDWDSRDKVGAEPLKKITDSIEEIESIDDLNKYYLETDEAEIFAFLWDCGSHEDFEDAKHNIIVVTPCSLSLDDSAEYTKLTDFGKIKKDAKSEIARKMLGKIGYSDEEIQEKLDNCYAFETAISGTIASNEEQKNPDYLSSIYNIYSYDELEKLQGSVPVIDRLKKLGYPEADKYMVYHPDNLTKLNELYTDDNLSMMKDYMIVTTARRCAVMLDRECFDWYLEYRNAVLGAKGNISDEDYFSIYVSDTLDWQVGRLYSDTYLKAEDKERISELVDEIIDVYHDVIKSADFLSDETKDNAIYKLDNLHKEVLYPDDWSKYSTEDLNFKSKDEGGTLWDALISISAYEIQDNVKKYSKDLDRSEWTSPPNFVNAQNSFTSNTIFIYGAYCQGGIYNSDMSDEEVYGTLGWIIAHEIAHAFDSTGAQFDKEGNMADWWTEEDYAAFRERNKKLADYFNNMHPWEGQDFYGDIYTGEAGADMAGMKAILMLAKNKKDFDYDKMFRSSCSLWLEKHTLERAYFMINNEHPMSYVRVNSTLQQFDEFLDCYDIKEGDGMYLAPEDRVIVW